MKDFRYLYGPVPSRRLGRSLGIDLVPHKICTYDCVYCQIGKTTQRTLLRKEYIPAKEILKEVERFFKEADSPIDHLSLSGSGEPTLNSEIRWIVEEIKKITSTPVAVITNGSLLYDENVRKDLLDADIVLPSLDAVSPEVFVKINRPHRELSVENVIGGLEEFRKIYKGQIWLELLFCNGINDSWSEVEKMKEVIERTQPDFIHINTIVRPPSEPWAGPLTQEEMEEIRNFFGEKAAIISEFDRHPIPNPEEDFRGRILKILERRPLSLTDLSTRMGIPSGELDRWVNLLVREKRIQIRMLGDSIYYEMVRG